MKRGYPRGYRYDPEKMKEEAIKEDDHLLDA
jgi:hypothetical protein